MGKNYFDERIAGSYEAKWTLALRLHAGRSFLAILQTIVYAGS